MRWIVKAFVTRDGTVVDDWESTVSERALAKFDERLRILRDRELRDWPYEYAHKLKGTEGIYEIKFEADKIAYRPLLFLGPGNREFTILVFAEERNNILKPVGALDTAKTRKQTVINTPGMAQEYEP